MKEQATTRSGTTAGDLPAPVQMLEMLASSFVARSIGVAVELNVADLLAAGPQSTAYLAHSAQCQEESLYRLLRALASVGVFYEQEERVFRNTSVSETLRRDAPGSLKAMASFLCGSTHWAAWTELLHSVQTGESAFEKAYGSPPFAYMADHPPFAAVFNEAMTRMSELELQVLPPLLDVTECKTLVDVGGGHGALLRGVLERNPHLNGILFDTSEVIGSSREETEDLGSRWATVAGNFFEEVPAGDSYLLKYILHDWGDVDAKRILDCIYQSSEPGTKLFIMEPVLKPRNTHDFAKLLDVQVLMFYGKGRERTADELTSLIRGSGFELDRTIENASLVSILVATRT